MILKSFQGRSSISSQRRSQDILKKRSQILVRDDLKIFSRKIYKERSLDLLKEVLMVFFSSKISRRFQRRPHNSLRDNPEMFLKRKSQSINEKDLQIISRKISRPSQEKLQEHFTIFSKHYLPKKISRSFQGWSHDLFEKDLNMVSRQISGSSRGRSKDFEIFWEIFPRMILRSFQDFLKED